MIMDVKHMIIAFLGRVRSGKGAEGERMGAYNKCNKGKSREIKVYSIAIACLSGSRSSTVTYSLT